MHLRPGQRARPLSPATASVVRHRCEPPGHGASGGPPWARSRRPLRAPIRTAQRSTRGHPTDAVQTPNPGQMLLHAHDPAMEFAAEGRCTPPRPRTPAGCCSTGTTRRWNRGRRPLNAAPAPKPRPLVLDAHDPAMESRPRAGGWGQSAHRVHDRAEQRGRPCSTGQLATPSVFKGQELSGPGGARHGGEYIAPEGPGNQPGRVNADGVLRVRAQSTCQRRRPTRACEPGRPRGRCRGRSGPEPSGHRVAAGVGLIPAYELQL